MAKYGRVDKGIVDRVLVFVRRVDRIKLAIILAFLFAVLYFKLV